MTGKTENIDYLALSSKRLSSAAQDFLADAIIKMPVLKKDWSNVHQLLRRIGKGCSIELMRQIKTLVQTWVLTSPGLFFSLRAVLVLCCFVLFCFVFGRVLFKDLLELQAAQCDSSQYVWEQSILHSEKGY